MTATMLETDVDWQTLEDMPIACEMETHASGAYNHAGDAEWYTHWTCCNYMVAVCDPYKKDFVQTFMDWFGVCGRCRTCALVKDLIRFIPIRN